MIPHANRGDDLRIRLRLSDPAYAERLAAFLRSVGVTATPAGDDMLEIDPSVDQDELGIYLRVWGVLNPEGAAEVEPESA
jgi:hypothetical protein